MTFLINTFELISVIICLVFSTVLLVVPIPRNKYLIPYRNSTKVLSISYFIIGILSSLFLFLNIDGVPTEPIDFLTIIISSLHAFLFTLTLIILINPRFNRKKFVLESLLPISVICIYYVSVVIIKGYTEVYNFHDIISNIGAQDISIRVISFMFYIFQLIYYTNLFLKEKKNYAKKINNFFSNTNVLNLKWVELIFYSLLFIASYAIIIQLYPNVKINLIFTVLINIYYLIFALNYLNYIRFFKIIEPHVEILLEPSHTDNHPKFKSNNWNHYKKQVLDEKYYLIQGITLENLAQKLALSRTLLSNLINNEEGVNFNIWINSMRINDAKKLLLKHPEFNITEIAERLGFSEVSNFSRQFKLVTGKSPSLWKKTLLEERTEAQLN